MLTTSEARSHLVIVETIRDVQDNVISEQTAFHRMFRPLESFAPRCNCGRVLRWSPWVDEVRAARCRCGHWFRECR